ncbi:hypothetical protein A9Z42_0009780 [Trichoderma parareesei]|uniref:Uncharacterized protein n=1 Tax=Trichoderma parareesei TaxID=858221 RepID=A0A2H2YXX2_TRIPA|nr:hypothetical protein A9Z42_0009780 [Trichoderma parareesei]
MAAPVSSFGASSTGHYLGVGLDFEAVGIAAYSSLESAYHGDIHTAGGDGVDEGDDEGRGDANGSRDNPRNGDDGSKANGNGGKADLEAIQFRDMGRRWLHSSNVNNTSINSFNIIISSSNSNSGIVFQRFQSLTKDTITTPTSNRDKCQQGSLASSS